MADVVWAGFGAQKLFHTSGEFTTTVKSSQSVSAVDTQPRGISFDGTNTPWCGSQASKMYLTSGMFTGTIKTSQFEPAPGITSDFQDVGWDGTNTPVLEDDVFDPSGVMNKVFLTSGQFTATVKTSQVLSSGGGALGVSFDGTNTLITMINIGGLSTDDKLMLFSGQFTATVKDSLNVTGVNGGTHGIGWNDTDTLWCGTFVAGKLYRNSGQFTSTIRDSVFTPVSETSPTAIDTVDVVNRLSGGPGGGAGSIAAISLGHMQRRRG